MSGTIQPTGPVDRLTYWRRRAFVGIVALLLVTAIIVGVRALLPKPAAVAEPDPTPTLTATVPAPAAPASTPAPTPDPTPTASTPAASAPATAAAPATPAAPAACQPDSLRLSIAGAPRVKSGTDEGFKLGIVNAGTTPCVVDVKPDTVEIKVTSGTDQIWTTAHCPGWVAPATKTLAPEQGHEWDLTWGTRRSAAECQLTGDYLRPGTYVAQFSYGSAKADKLVIQLVG